MPKQRKYATFTVNRDGLHAGTEKIRIDITDGKRGESMLDFLARATQRCGGMCPCDYCRVLRSL